MKNNTPDNRPFFIGWESTTSPAITKFLKRFVLSLILISILGAGLLAVSQKSVSDGLFEFGKPREFSGVLVRDPVPILLLDEPVDGKFFYYLVHPLKNGFPDSVASEFHLNHVSIKGTYIGNKTDAMIEVIPGSVNPTGKNTQSQTSSQTPTDQGTVSLTGEIVDSKCHLGVMNPGRFKPHRACAIQCIRGGIPPLLVTQSHDGQLNQFLIVNTDGSPINRSILDLIAIPVTITGQLKTSGPISIIYTSKDNIRSL